MTGIFYSWDCSIFQYQRCANPASNWALFIKRSSTNTLEKLHCCSGKTNCIHCSRNAVLFWETEQGYLSLTTKKHTSLETFFPSESRAVQPNEARWSLSLRSTRARARSSGRNAHIRSSHRRLRQQEPWLKKLSETCTNPEGRFLPQKYSVILPNRFLKLWPCLAWESNSLTV